MSDITVDLGGQHFRLIGERGELGDAVTSALRANGALPAEPSELPDLLLVCPPLLPDSTADGTLLTSARELGLAMALRGHGRIAFLLSAIAELPMRRHFGHSVAMAGLLAGVRGLAMELAPSVLVNAVGAGLIEHKAGGVLAGDRRMLGHAALGRPGTVEDIVNAVLFLSDPLNSYTTGQMLNVDGGWSTGYGRNF